MSMYKNAPGRADLETSLLAADIVGTFLDILNGRLLGVVVNGRVPSTALSGQLGPSQGGTGNAIGQTTPLDGSVTDIKVAVGAEIDPAKLDQVKLLINVYELLKDILVGVGIDLDYDDILHVLTLTATGSGSAIRILNVDGGVDIAAAEFLRFGAGSVSAEADGAVYMPPVTSDGTDLYHLVPVLDILGDPIVDIDGNIIYVYGIFTPAPPTPYTEGDGIDITAFVVSAVADPAGGLTVGASGIGVTVPLPVALGGTGSITAAAARAELGIPGRYAVAVGDGVATSIDVVHNLGSRDVITQVYQNSSTWDVVVCDIRNKDSNTVTVIFAVAPTTDQYRVVCVG